MTRKWWLTPLLGAVLSCVTIVAIHRASPRTLVSSHGMVHTAIAREFVDGAHHVPPDNPFYAGAPLPYYWVYQFTAAKVASLFAVHPLVAFELLTLAAMFALWFAAARLGERLGGTIAHGALVAALALCGANAAGIVILALRVTLLGGSIPADGSGYLWGIAHPVVGMARAFDPFSLYGPLALFFINISSRPVALGTLLVLAAALLAWMQSGGKPALAGIGLSAALCTLFSPLIGLSAGLSVAGGLVVAAAVAREGVWSAPRLAVWRDRRSLAAAVAIVAGIAAASPTFLVLASQGGRTAIAFDTNGVLAPLVSGLVLIALAPLGVRATSGVTRQVLVAIVAAGTVMLGASVVLRLPTGNEVNFFHGAALLLGVPAAAAFLPPGRRLLKAGAVALMLATTALVLWSFTGRPDVPVRFEGRHLVRVAGADGLAALYAWVQDSTPRNAVFVIDPRRPVVTAAGNAPEFPALTGRPIFVSESPDYLTSFPDAARRRALALELIRGGAPADSDRAYARALERPFYIITRDARDSLVLDGLSRVHGAPQFARSGLAVFRWRP